MSFDNDYSKRKDHRKKYYDSRGVDRTCRNHGSCDWCKINRTFFDRKYRYAAVKDYEEYLKWV